MNTMEQKTDQVDTIKKEENMIEELDEELDEYYNTDRVIKNTRETIKALENPIKQDIQIDNNKEDLDKLYETMKNMPRNEILKLLGQLQKLETNDTTLITMTEKNIKKYKDSLKKKLSDRIGVMKMMRNRK